MRVSALRAEDDNTRMLATAPRVSILFAGSSCQATDHACCQAGVEASLPRSRCAIRVKRMLVHTHGKQVGKSCSHRQSRPA